MPIVAGAAVVGGGITEGKDGNQIGVDVVSNWVGADMLMDAANYIADPAVSIIERSNQQRNSIPFFNGGEE